MILWWSFLVSRGDEGKVSIAMASRLLDAKLAGALGDFVVLTLQLDSECLPPAIMRRNINNNDSNYGASLIVWVV